MRIISGKAKGLKITSPSKKSQVIRPTSDRCREALFSILATMVIDAKILDLYAGTGALGIEALSRGCQTAFFVDYSTTALNLIKTNLSTLHSSLDPRKTTHETTVIRYDLSKGLPPLEKYLQSQSSVFDIIFLDPPYGKGLSLRTLEDIDRSNYLDQDGIIVVEDRSGFDFPKQYQKIKLTDKRKYGDTGFWFYQYL